MKIATLLSVVLCSQLSLADTFEQSLGRLDVGEVAPGAIQVPFITWGGDVATFVANGGISTANNSFYLEKGLSLKLVAGDNFPQQIKDYMSGRSPFLRGTLDMVVSASDVINKDPRTKPIVFLQLTWSLGDHLVGRKEIRTINDLKDEKVCLQQSGPHIRLIDDSLTAANMTWDDIQVVWVKDLTATDDSPAAKFRQDSSIAACCVISPDMLSLTSGLSETGSGREGTVAGAHVVNSTAFMSRSIADVYCVRTDFYNAHKDIVEKFTVGYLQTTEKLMRAKEKYNNGRGNSPEYISALKLAQKIYGNNVLPSIEEDAHGLVSDANFVRIPGNEIFFEDANNLTGFAARQKVAFELAEKLGTLKNKVEFAKATWDYKKLSEQVGVPYVVPVYSKGKIKAEIADFSEDLDDSTILSFEIKFEPEQDTFPVSSYEADFKKYCESRAIFANSIGIIEGHSDLTLALQHFFWAAKAKGLLTGEVGHYKFKGQPLNLLDTKKVVAYIQSENLSGQKRKDKNGQVVDIPDPKETVAAALTLSQARAQTVKKAIEAYAKENNFDIDTSQSLPHGVGISSPVNPRPKNMDEARENMRVVFRMLKNRKSEATSNDDFDFEK